MNVLSAENLWRNEYCSSNEHAAVLTTVRFISRIIRAQRAQPFYSKYVVLIWEAMFFSDCTMIEHEKFFATVFFI